MAGRFSKFHSKLVLALLFFAHLIKRALFFWKRVDGLKTFFEQYAADAIFPITESERSLMPSYQRCQACSLCTFSCTAIKEGRAPSSFEPKFILLGYGRSAHESEYFLEEWLPCAECNACTVECPNEVPIHVMAQQVIERRQQLGFRRPG